MQVVTRSEALRLYRESRCASKVTFPGERREFCAKYRGHVEPHANRLNDRVWHTDAAGTVERGSIYPGTERPRRKRA